ncbi:phosphoribosylglycinamide formyltransferase [Oenococcus oeni]|uniref:Phosphoribosylglycinamide formyltransferase n=1 Tax=Oenococcus oeni TaxID=1247 RepID=A0AAQ2UW12_OENOE|nr:phosphoribosylglycinamide formyltransferase [Oenococcus oeni]SYW07432.1 phosphoribosylglycinamide formyltransferase [Oenococcus oeni]VDB98364.1 phosphoribosylglycinamide formyltransferase [Oenococcus oeni]
MNPIRLAVFASGNGTNFTALVNYVKKQLPNVEIVRLIVDHKNAFVIQRAKKLEIPSTYIDYRKFKDKAAAETEIIGRLKEDQVSGILLAGFMRIIGPDLLLAFPNRIINIHPALLPSFPGRHGIEDAFEYGVKVTGVTIHYVDNGVDSGEIIAQAPVRIKESDNLESLEKRIHRLEHRLYPQTLRQLIKKGVFTV